MNPYDDATDSKWPFAIMALVLTAAVVAGCSYAQSRKATTYKEQYLPGQPLDAVKLSSPSFAQGDYCYKVADRTSGACWWLVRMDDGWHVLPICEGRSYVDQQLKEQGSDVSE